MKQEKKITFRDLAFLLLGVFLGIVLCYIWLYLGIVGITSHINFGDIVIELNETRIVQEFYQLSFPEQQGTYYIDDFELINMSKK